MINAPYHVPVNPNSHSSKPKSDLRMTGFKHHKSLILKQFSLDIAYCFGILSELPVRGRTGRVSNPNENNESGTPTPLTMMEEPVQSHRNFFTEELL